MSFKALSPRRVIMVAPFLIMVFLANAAAWACDTPVYRYAMYRWQPAPYEVYFFHDQPVAEADRAVHESIQRLIDDRQVQANLAFMPVDVTADPELNNIPPDIKKAWQAQTTELPAYLVATPQGMPIHIGAMSPSDVSGLFDSPVRQKMAKSLESGSAGFLVLLSGHTAPMNEEPASVEAAKLAAEANKKAEQQVQRLIQDVRSGKISLYAAPSQMPPGTGAEEEGPSHQLDYLQLDRDDVQEQWLIRSLLAVEGDLTSPEFYHKPMLFVVYGRGRALPPYIGDGISRDNLLAEVEFITGACSCTVKEQNPGVDLPTHYDWEMAAQLLADRYGTEEGNESRFGGDQFFPELIIPPTDSVAEAAATEPSTDEPATAVEDPVDTPTEPTPTEPTPDQPTPDAAPPADEDQSSSRPDALASNQSMPEDAAGTEPRPSGGGQSALNSVWLVGVGVALALLVLFGATFLVLRPR